MITAVGAGIILFATVLTLLTVLAILGTLLVLSILAVICLLAVREERHLDLVLSTGADLTFACRL